MQHSAAMPPLQGNIKLNRRSRRTRESRTSKNNMMESARDSFSNALSQVGDGSSFAAGDLSPLDDLYEGQGFTPTPKVNEFSEGLTKTNAPHARMLQAQVSSFVNATPIMDMGSILPFREVTNESSIGSDGKRTSSALTKNQEKGPLLSINQNKKSNMDGNPTSSDPHGSHEDAQSSRLKNNADGDCSSEEGIPIPEELSVSQIPIDHKSELLHPFTPNLMVSSVLTPATAETSSMMITSQLPSQSCKNAQGKSSGVVTKAYKSPSSSLFTVNTNTASSRSKPVKQRQTPLGQSTKPSFKKISKDSFSSQSRSVVLNQKLVAEPQLDVLDQDSSSSLLLLAKDNHSNNSGEYYESSKQGMSCHQQIRIETKALQEKSLIASPSGGILSPISIRSSNVKQKLSQIQRKNSQLQKKQKQSNQVMDSQQVQEAAESTSPSKVPASPTVEKGKTLAQQVPASRMPALQSKRLPLIDELVKGKGSHYNVFKRNANLLELFDACKTFEEDKSSFMSAAGAASTEEESNEAENDEGLGTRIKPLDPSLKDVRYLPPKPDSAPAYTLVLDLDETLIHYRDSGADTQTEDESSFGDEKRPRQSSSNKLEQSPEKLLTEEDEEVVFFIRPGLSAFLSELANFYELVLYTAATREYADYFLRLIDHKNLFKNNILTREHCQFEGDYAIKDLRLLGRDLRKTIIIDNLKENFEKTTPDNGIHISNFEGCFADEELPKYQRFLRQLACNEEDDVRNVIYDYRGHWQDYQ